MGKITWLSYDEHKPQPGAKFVAVHDDGCSSGIYVMFDDGPSSAADGWHADAAYFKGAIWTALPADYPIRFMEVTKDDWR